MQPHRQGFSTRVNLPDHPVLDGIDFETLLGWNETRPREGGDAIVEIEFVGRWYSLLAARPWGRRRVTAWTTGASPHGESML